jgi:hypothetical protein
VDGVYGLRLDLDGPPQPLDAVAEFETLGVVHQLVAVAIFGFGEDPRHPAFFRALRDNGLGHGA